VNRLLNVTEQNKTLKEPGSRFQGHHCIYMYNMACRKYLAQDRLCLNYTIKHYKLW